MEDELKAYLDEMRREINDGQERRLNRLASLEQVLMNTKGFLVGDAIISGRRWLDVDECAGRVEPDQRSGPQG